MCPASADLTVTIIGMGLLTALIAGMVGHGALRPLMEARGVSPWRLRDSLGALTLVLIGSACVGGASSAFAVWGVARCSVAGWSVTVVSAAIVLGILMLRLGLLALRKLV